MDAFDTDVLIYAIDHEHQYFPVLRQLFFPTDPTHSGNGSVLLHAEALGKPIRRNAHSEVLDIARLTIRLRLLPTTAETVSIATTLASMHGLRAADAIHLATAVEAGADRFITNNRRDFTAPDLRDRCHVPRRTATYQYSS